MFVGPWLWWVWCVPHPNRRDSMSDTHEPIKADSDDLDLIADEFIKAMALNQIITFEEAEKVEGEPMLGILLNRILNRHDYAVIKTTNNS